MIESASELASGSADTIKTHHNDTDLVRQLRQQVTTTSLLLALVIIVHSAVVLLFASVLLVIMVENGTRHPCFIVTAALRAVIATLIFYAHM